MDVKFNKWYVNRKGNLPFISSRVQKLKIVSRQSEEWAECEFVRYDGGSGKAQVPLRGFDKHWKLENIVLENK